MNDTLLTKLLIVSFKQLSCDSKPNSHVSPVFPLHIPVALPIPSMVFSFSFWTKV